ncbi:MAG: hypothetical protein KJZ86_15435 [Caldilineaceae bacterium]|nr:hypothetical protein [Caldilineaceae bacterium]
MERLAEVATEDVVARHAGPLARQMVGAGERHRATAEGSPSSGPGNGEELESSLSTLQEILLGPDRDQIQLLRDDMDALRHQIGDKDALAAAVAPILGEAIRRQIQESREEIIDALYPVIGQIVMRAVTEAMRDLARSIDEKLQAATDFQRFSRRLRSLFTGVPVSELALRESLPLLVQEIYLIHRESGLLLWHTSRTPEKSADSDLISGMLTAIREFAEQVLGGGGERLHQIRFGNRELVLEFGRYAYVGLIIDGVAPSNLRWKAYERVYAFEKKQQQRLRHYNGEAAGLTESARREFDSFLSVEAEIPRKP